MLSILHSIISILLGFSILLQQRASGLSATFGGTGATYVQRRGAERLLFQGAIYLGIAFFGLGILRIFY